MNTYLVTRPTPQRPVARAARRSVGFMPVATLAAPTVDMVRDGEDGVLTVEVPGLDPAADLSVTVTGDRLTVAGVRRSTTGGVRREARFSRSVTLLEDMTQDAVSADYSAGVLQVRITGLFPTPVVPETHTVAITSDVATVESPSPAQHQDQDQDQDTADRSPASGSEEERSEAPSVA